MFYNPEYTKEGGKVSRLKVGAFVASFRLPFEEAVTKAQELGLDGLQLASIKDEINVEEIDEKKAGYINKVVSDHGLVISAICGDIGGFSTDDKNLAADRVERTKRIMEGAARLGVGIIQSHIGVAGEDPNDARYAVMVKSLEDIGRFAESVGVVFASETGLESPAALRCFLDNLAVPAIKVNYDPANLVMNDFDQIGGVAVLKDYIVHSHAKDGLRGSGKDGNYKEVPVGKGDVDFPRYVSAMDSIGFGGFYTIERECGDNFVSDIRDAKEYLSRF